MHRQPLLHMTDMLYSRIYISGTYNVHVFTNLRAYIYIVYSESEITNPPVSRFAYLDTWSSFHCEGEGEVLLWQTNGELLTNEIKETRNITTHQDNSTTGIVNSTLLILAKPENDDLNIGCIVGIHGSLVFDSAGADLFVKGSEIIHMRKYFLICSSCTIKAL